MVLRPSSYIPNQYVMADSYTVILYICGFIFIGLVKIGKDPGLEEELGIAHAEFSFYPFACQAGNCRSFHEYLRHRQKQV